MTILLNFHLNVCANKKYINWISKDIYNILVKFYHNITSHFTNYKKKKDRIVFTPMSHQ